MSRAPGSRRKRTSRRQAGEDNVVADLRAENCDPARIRELYYWSREPGFLEIVRTFAALPESARAAVEAFVSMAHEPASITATWDRAGRLTLSSPQVAQTIAIAQHCSDHDDNGTPPRLN